ncbi:sensor histidine kinase [Natrialbaceae archaeon A-arb3/5]
MTTTDETVQVLIDHEANSTALSELLAKRYTVVTDETELIGDLFLVDDESFPSYRDRIESMKTGSAPSFSPVVLVRREETRISPELLEEPTGTEPPLIDDVITAPVREPVLFRRLSNLLVRRRQFERLVDQNERLDEFASVVSHDLRNPLQVAQGRLDLLDEELSNEAREHVEIAQESLDRMDSLIDNVLALAREGTTIDDTSNVPVHNVVTDAWTVVNSADAELDRPTAEGVMIADADGVSTMFENLFRNAIEHAGEDVTIDVGLEDGGFYVADDGPGIPPDEREQVLERGYSTTSDGTGLGLDIVANIVEAHGWELTVGKSEDGGARFDVTGVERP